MVLNCSQEPVWTGKERFVTPETLSEYALASKPRKVEMAASSIYGTLPRVPKYHRRQMSEAAIPVKYLTDPGKPSATKERKKSFLVGLKKKIRYAVDGKPKLNWSRGDDICGSTGSLYHEKTSMSTHRGHSKGLENIYSSQSKTAPCKDDVFRTYPESSSPNSSAPSSPESRRSSFSSKRARRSKARSHNTNRDSFGSISPEETAKKCASGTNVLIVGGEGVGKSALTVRFLTKRYIGEYAPEIESVYDQTINLEGKDVNVNIWDSAIPEIHQTSVENEESTNLTHSPSLHSVTSSSESCHANNRYSSGSFEDESAHKFDGLSRKNRLRKTINKTIRRFRSGEGSDTDDDVTPQPLTEAERRLRWADGVVVVYSICDRSSYKAACDVIRHVRDTEFNHIPILLLGNKADLHHRRLVETNEARGVALQSGCAFTEISVSEGYEPASNAMKDHIKTIRNVTKSRSKSRKNRS